MTGSTSAGCYRLLILGMSKINKSMNKYKVPNHIKTMDKILSSKGQLRSFLLQHAFYSVEEHIS
jgi:hypothetical protein